MNNKPLINPKGRNSHLVKAGEAIANLKQQLADKQKQLTDLQNTVNTLRNALEGFDKASDLWLPTTVDSEHIGEAEALHNLRSMLLTVLSKAPAQSLAGHDADVIEAMLQSPDIWGTHDDDGEYLVSVDSIKEYANTLHQDKEG